MCDTQTLCLATALLLLLSSIDSAVSIFSCKDASSYGLYNARCIARYRLHAPKHHTLHITHRTHPNIKLCTSHIARTQTSHFAHHTSHARKHHTLHITHRTHENIILCTSHIARTKKSRFAHHTSHAHNQTLCALHIARTQASHFTHHTNHTSHARNQTLCTHFAHTLHIAHRTLRPKLDFVLCSAKLCCAVPNCTSSVRAHFMPC